MDIIHAVLAILAILAASAAMLAPSFGGASLGDPKSRIQVAGMIAIALYTAFVAIRFGAPALFTWATEKLS